MKKAVFIGILWITSISVFAQRGKDGIGNITSGGTVVNAYTTLSSDVAAGAVNLDVADASSLSAGDLVMIIQMQGASVNIVNGGLVGPWWDAQNTEPPDTSYGRVNSLNGAGNNELAEINAISGNTLTLDCGLKYDYTVAGKTQIVRVKRYSALTISGIGMITCPHWDRSLGYGGIIAIEVEGNTSIATGGSIDASGFGFHGGAVYTKTVSTAGSVRWGSVYRNEGVHKGESIVGDTTFYKTYAGLLNKGATANGGGGGNSINAGGGGGANAGQLSMYNGGIGNIDTTSYSNLIHGWEWEAANLTLWRTGSSGGGRGGYTFSSATNSPLSPGGTAPNNASWSGDNRRIEGGLGGRPLDYSTGLLFLGGGGGAGDYDNGYGGAGGDGGGIVYLVSYGTVSGGGSILANGADGSSTNAPSAFALTGRDGAGGAGGGGAVVIKSTGNVTGITVSAKGGRGGDNQMRNGGASTKDTYGPGGGGGGGYIGIPSGSTATTNVSAGANGIVTFLAGSYTTKIPKTDGTGFPPNGATKGGVGVVSSSITTFAIVTTNDTICSGNTSTLTVSLSGTAPNPVTVSWYTDSIGGSAFATGTSYTTPALTNTTTYWVGTCPGTYREKVVVVVSSGLSAPTTTNPSYCQNASATDLSSSVTSGGTLNWYTVPSGGSASGTAPTPSTATVGTLDYYVSTGNTSCESPRSHITVTINTLPAIPAATDAAYCVGDAASAVSATGAGTFNWYTTPTGGSGTTTAPTPVTTAADTLYYYVSQTDGNNCEGGRDTLTVIVNALPNAPTVVSPVSYCQNEAASQLSPNGAQYNWYTVPTGGAGTTTAPTPSTVSTGTVSYYVSETQNSCEGPRAQIDVVVQNTLAAPTVTDTAYCVNQTSVDVSNNVFGATGSLTWYDAASGGTTYPSAPTPSTTSATTYTYYVSQGSASCESGRSPITVTINALPAIPTATDASYCVGDAASVVSATGAGTFNWYTTPTGGSGTTTAPTPSTASADTLYYYVSQTDGNSCEGGRDTLTVIVNPIPAAPTVVSPISYCQNEQADTLAPSGAQYTWYDAASGGNVYSPTPVPSTVSTGTVSYYVSETQNSCEGPRAQVDVVVQSSYVAPTVSDTVYCVNQTSVDVSNNVFGATGSLTWYDAASGGTTYPSAPTPSTNSATTYTYYVSQGSGSCESGRSPITVTINALPAMPTATDTAYCVGDAASAVSATGTGTLNWYTDSIGGSVVTPAPTPITASADTLYYYVSQADANGCEGGRDTLTVIVNPIPAAPTVVSPISYCQNEQADTLAPSSAQYTWYDAASGGNVYSPTPVPSTVSTGTVSYYVSETQNSCEGPRAQVDVIVNTTYTDPVVNDTSYCEGAVALALTNNVSGNTGTLNWYASATGGIADPNTPTPSTTVATSLTYYVSQGSGTCESGRSLITIVVNPLPAAPSGTDTTYCINESHSPLTAVGTGVLTWYTTPGGSGSGTAPDPSTSSAGTTDYYVSQTDANGCESNLDTVTVVVQNLQNAPTVSDTSYCINDSAVALSAIGTSTLSWWGTAASGGTSSSTSPTPLTSSAGTTTYYVSQGTGACESPRADINVVVNALPSASFTPANAVICETLCVDFTNDTTYTSVAWNFGDGDSSALSNPQHCYQTAGVYDVTLTATDTNGCTNTMLATSAVTVEVAPTALATAAPDGVVNIGTEVSFESTTTAVSGNYHWDFADPSSGASDSSSVKNPSHTFDNAGTYCVVLTITSSPCWAYGSVCVEVVDYATITIPNIITPNDDGVNDQFIITSSGIKTIEGNIYDRWGMMVYSWNSLNDSWNGKNKSGKSVSNGVYFYVIKATDLKDEQKEYNGYLQVISSQ